MKRALAFLCVLMLSFSLCACGQKASPTAPESAPKTATPDSGDSADTSAAAAPQEKQEGGVKIEVTLPEGWAKNEGSVLPVHYMKGTASFMAKEEPFSGATLDDVVKEALEIYQKSFDNLTVQEEAEPFTVDEKDARRMTFTCTVSKMQMKFLYVYLFAADKVYVITFGDMENTFDALADDYEAILSGIRFATQ